MARSSPAAHISGNAGANVKGTVINLDDTGVNLTGSSDIIIASTGTTNYPAGVVFGTHFAPLPDTYQEICAIETSSSPANSATRPQPR